MLSKRKRWKTYFCLGTVKAIISCIPHYIGSQSVSSMGLKYVLKSCNLLTVKLQ